MSRAVGREQKKALADEAARCTIADGENCRLGWWEGEVMVVRSGRPGGVTGFKVKGGFSQVELWESE